MSFLQNFPSFTVIFQNVWNTTKRFPYAMLSTLSATTFALILSESDKSESEALLLKLLLFSCLGIPLFIALKIFSDKHHWKYLKSIQLQTVGLLLLLLYYFLTPLIFESPVKYMIQYGLFFIFCLFLNAILPYLKGKNVQGFWQYNKSLFISLLISALYSHVMGVGLTIALVAMDHLFNMDIDSKRYFQVWIVISLLFNTTLFLSKLPTDLDALEEDYSYPKGIKVFVQYILLPLVGLYLVILYAYEAKIIIEWNWPIGWVSNLVLWYSVVSILSLLLIYPLQKIEEDKWIQVYSKWFFRALIPLIAMLFMAIFERISQYGITEPRYLVLAMAVGLAVVVLYFVISKTKDIRIIPFVIALLAFISALGPWSASAVSKSSQQNRLETLLIQNKLFVDNILVIPEESPDFESRKEMSSIVSYLENTHGFEPFIAFLDDSVLTELNFQRKDLKTESQSIDSIVHVEKLDVCELLGFEYVSRWNSESFGEYYFIHIPHENALELEGYDKLYNLKDPSNSANPNRIIIDSLDCYVRFDQENATFTLSIGDTISINDDFGIINLSDTLRVLSKLGKDVILKPTSLSFDLVSKKYDVKIVLNEIRGNVGEKLTISSFDAVLLLKKK